MRRRVSRCVVCPNCHPRYAIRYASCANGASLVVEVADLYILHCACGESCRFTLSQLQLCSVPEWLYLRDMAHPTRSRR